MKQVCLVAVDDSLAFGGKIKIADGKFVHGPMSQGVVGDPFQRKTYPHSLLAISMHPPVLLKIKTVQQQRLPAIF